MDDERKPGIDEIDADAKAGGPADAPEVEGHTIKSHARPEHKDEGREERGRVKYIR